MKSRELYFGFPPLTALSYEELRTYHLKLAEALAEEMRKPESERNPTKIAELRDELRRSGELLAKMKRTS